MSRLYMLSGLLCLSGLVMLGLQALSSMMTQGDIAWKTINIITIVDVEYIKWIDGISWDSIQNILNYVTIMPLYLFFLYSSGFCLIFGFVTKNNH